MFIALLFINLFVAIVVSGIVAAIFRKPILNILKRLIGEDIFLEWAKYLRFAIYVVGVSGGVQVWQLERYIFKTEDPGSFVDLTSERMIWELYRTIIGTLQSVAWMLLVFFLVALIAFVIVKGREIKRQMKAEDASA